MSLKIFAQEADQSLFDKLNELNSTYYDENHPILDSIYLRWIYLDNPAGRATLILVEQDEIYIGVMALIPIMLINQGKHQNACFCIHVLSHPGHRNKRLFLKMINFTKKHLEENGIWLLGHPNKNAIRGWRKQKMQFKPSLLAHLSKFRWPFTPYKVTKVTSITELEELPNEFWNRSIKNGMVYMNDNPEFISWRYLNAPFCDYEVSLITKDNQPVGINVTKAFKGPLRLMVHYYSNLENLSQVVRANKLTIVMVSNISGTSSSILKGCWKLPVQKHMPFFLSDWDVSQKSRDYSLLTLGVSDL